MTTTPTHPLYLSGAFSDALTGRAGFGWMRTPLMGNRPPDAPMPWGADNGCFSLKGERAFKLETYLDWLRAQDVKTCLFAAAPDKVGDPHVTLERSLPVLPAIRALGYPAAFVAQDGLEHLTVPWDAFDVLFLGGLKQKRRQDEWKLGPAAAALTAEATRRGKWVHMGRVNSKLRYDYAASIGVDSVDGTYLKYGPTVNLPKLLSWVGTPEPTLREAA
jgi:hypothetical protein